jgi:predicted GTPase
MFSRFNQQAKGGGPDRDPGPGLRLVVGLNRVDQIVPGGWDTRLNQPSERAAAEIRRKCEYTIDRLSRDAGISATHIEYYSALKRYRLHQVLNRVIAHCMGGFKLGDVDPKHFEDVEGVDPDVQRFAKEERARRASQSTAGRPTTALERIISELSRTLRPEDVGVLKERFGAEMSTPPRVAVLGQSGVGKTTTVNALFATEWATSAVEVGTHTAQEKTVPLAAGGRISITDLPGYGRSLAEDAKYESIYRDVLPTCDLVLLVIQADRGDLADDVEMIVKLSSWLAGAPAPVR